MISRWMRAPVSSEVAAKAITITAMKVRAASIGMPSAAMNARAAVDEGLSLGASPEAAPQLA